MRRYESASMKALEVVDIAINGLSVALGTWRIVVKGASCIVSCVDEALALSIPVVGEVLVAVGAVIDIAVTILEAIKLTPVQKWVKDEGSKTMNSVSKPTSQWLLDHPMPDTQG